MKCILYYTGNHDLTSERVQKPITFFLPDGSEWKDFKIKEKSKGLEMELKKESKTVSLICPLIKSNEFINVEGLYEGETSAFDYRIENIAPLKSESFSTLASSKLESV